MLRNWEVEEFIDDINTEIADKVEEYLTEHFKEVKAEDLGLDRRAAEKLWVSESAIVMKGSTRSLDYYGGFEYVDQENRRVLADYTFYMIEEDDGRIRGHIGRVFPEVIPDMEDEE
jgi:hypothetical protein